MYVMNLKLRKTLSLVIGKKLFSFSFTQSRVLFQNNKNKKKELSLQVIKFKQIYTRDLKGHCCPSLAKLSA